MRDESTIEAIRKVRRAWRALVRSFAQELLRWAGEDDDMGGTKPDGTNEEGECD